MIGVAATLLLIRTRDSRAHRDLGNPEAVAISA
jgi:hypothetical protein